MSLPGRRGHAVAEPLVGELVGDQPLGRAVEVVAPEDRLALGLERDLEGIVGDDHRVAGLERVRPEALDEDLQHLAAGGRRPARIAAERRRGDDAGMGTVESPASSLVVAADVEGHEVRRRRLHLVVHPRGAAAGGRSDTSRRWPPRGTGTSAVTVMPERCLLRGRGRCTGTRWARRSAGRRRAPRRSSSSHPTGPHVDRPGAGCRRSGTSTTNAAPSAISGRPV